MSEEVLARACEPFYSTRFQGRGLGLAATKGVVEGHGGALLIESDDATTVAMILPVV